MSAMRKQDPHASQSVLQAGAPIADARLAAIMLHGRGASAEDILGLAKEFAHRDIAYLAPQAAGNTWYPYSFLMPIDQNEPALSSALRLIATLLASLRQQNFPPEKIVVMGFSQGACLSLEFVARHAQRYAAVAAFSGGLIGPPGAPREYPGSLDGTPVFMGCSDVDPHIPVDRVYESADVLTEMGAVVDTRIYPRMGHTINSDEIEAVNALLRP
ncbi:MAG TPA: dienelactone hydrolase family protein [Vicinamibacterales bacterium]|nr:dienelactone hydrolase family protein [Vicinamibacterales bacterium]